MKGIILPREPEDDQSIPYQVMDLADEQQIISSVEGEFTDIAKEFVYQFTDSNGRTVKGLSWVGTKQTAIELARKKKASIQVEDIDYENDPSDDEYVLFKAKAKDLISGRVAIGVKRQWRYMQKRNGQKVKNEFWFEQGVSKAKRNAMQELMPVSFVIKLIEAWIKEGSVKQLTTPKDMDKPTVTAKTKLRPYFEEIEKQETKKGLSEFERKLIVDNNEYQKLTGQEMYWLRRAVAAKMKKL